MASSNACWGIECGSGAIKAIKLELRGEEVVVTDFVILPHPKVLSTPGLDPHDAMRVALGTLVAQYDLTNARIAVGVPGQASFARFAKLPPVDPKKVRDIVKYEAQQQIPFPLDQVEWDFQTFQSPDSPDVEVGIFAMTKERLKQQLDLLSDVGLTPDVVTLNPVAAYNALAFDLEFTEKTPGTILLDIGTTSTDLIVAEAGRVWVRTFPRGGHHFTEAIVSTFKLSYPKADRLKREAQATKHAKHVVQAMRPVFSDLVQDVQRSIGYYQSLHREANLTRLIGLGATFAIPGLRKYLKQQIGLDTYRLEQFKRCTLADDSRAEALAENAGLLVVAYGLALQGLQMQTIDANLVPVENVREAMWRRKVPYFAAAAGLALVASGAMFYRPFTDKGVVEGMRPPTTVAEASSLANTLKSEAMAAKVLGGATPDYAAANAIALAEHPVIHAHLLRDLGEMLHDADTKLQGETFPEGESVAGPAFGLITFDTSFVPSGDSIKDYAMPAGQRRPSQSPDDFAEEEPNLNTKRIAIRLKARTHHPEPTKFVIDSIEKWLQANASRPGVPYSIVYDPKTLMVDLQLAKELASAAVAGGQNTTPIASGQRDPRPTQPRRREHAQFDPDDAPPGTYITTGQPPPSNQGVPQLGDKELEALAAISRPVEEEPAPESTVDLFWYVVIGDRAAGEDDQ
ncbi:MAG: type IV pilus assembly protein PilM [Phycisphaeraceae bacterium]|nr:type IV pilus assembly protein PilM [Phycisphaeraceae bacterium]